MWVCDFLSSQQLLSLSWLRGVAHHMSDSSRACEGCGHKSSHAVSDGCHNLFAANRKEILSASRAERSEFPLIQTLNPVSLENFECVRDLRFHLRYFSMSLHTSRDRCEVKLGNTVQSAPDLCPRSTYHTQQVYFKHYLFGVDIRVPKMTCFDAADDAAPQRVL